MGAICRNCGKEITTKSHKRGGVKQFCDLQCYREFRNTANWTYVTCHYCGKVFKEQRDAQNLYCSKGCASRAVAEMKREQRAEINAARSEHDRILLEEYRAAKKHADELLYRLEHEKFCKVCGKLFIARNMNYECCSPECSRKADNARRDKRIKRNGEPDLTISLHRLYRRDGGICQLCGKVLDFDRDPNDAEYPSIDHIIPLSKGGTHTWENVQLACRRCNWEKSDRV